MTQLNNNKLRGGSRNPIVFNDYESFVAKFADGPHTTDDCYTPRDVYEAVVQYVSEVYPLDGKQILRPFYPGGDYEHADYPDDGVVIDNPPFSMFTKICQFYAERSIPFFLFGPGMTIFGCCKYGCTAVVADINMKFDNGALIRVNFASNLFGDVLAMTAPRLAQLIEPCPSQNIKVGLTKYHYPDNLLSVSDMQIIASGGVEFAVRRDGCSRIRRLDGIPPRKTLFGDHYIMSDDLAKAKAKAKAKADRTIHVSLSEREREIIKGLG